MYIKEEILVNNYELSLLPKVIMDLLSDKQYKKILKTHLNNQFKFEDKTNETNKNVLSKISEDDFEKLIENYINSVY